MPALSNVVPVTPQDDKETIAFISTCEDRVDADTADGFADDLLYLRRYKEMINSINNFSTSSTRPIFKGHLQRKPVTVLWDTGATANFVAKEFVEKHQLRTEKAAQAVNVTMGDGTSYTCTQTLVNPVLAMGGYDDNQWTFTIAPLQEVDVILGAPWWAAMLPQVDCRSGKGQFFTSEGQSVSLKVDFTIDPPQEKEWITSKPKWSEQMWFVAAIDTPTVPPSPSTAEFEEIHTVLQEFDHLLRDSLPNQLPPSRAVDHQIVLEPGAKPPSLPPYRLPLAYAGEMKVMLNDLLRRKLIAPSNSPFGAPVIFVKKKNGGLRMCVDYRALNKITKKDKFPLPRADDLLDKLHGSTVFSSLDAVSGYYQIRIAPEDVEKTAFRTTQGHYEFKVLPFGLTNAPATFQALMNSIVEEFDLGDFVVVYLDDILVHSKTLKEHAQHLRRLFQALAHHQLFLSRNKCSFGQSEVFFLGFKISGEGIRPDPAKGEALLNWAAPINKGELRSFLGAANWHSKHIPHYATIAAPLTDLQGERRPYVWTAAQQDAFQELKAALVSPTVLVPPQPDCPFEMYCDASGIGIGAALYQAQGDGNLKPIAFLSRKLSLPEQRYSTRDMELLALVHALGTWRHYLLGTRTTVYTDHKSVTNFLSQKVMPSTAKYARWMDLFAEYDLDIRYIRGKANVVADALSRKRHLLTPEEDVDVPDADGIMDSEFICMLSASTPQSPLLRRIREAAKDDAWYQERLHSENRAFSLVDGLLAKGSVRHAKLVVPALVRNDIIKEYHEATTAGHPGIKKTISLVERHFWWPELHKDIKSYVRSCQSCQRNKPINHAPYGRLQPVEIPDAPWLHINLDFFGPFPTTKNGHSYCMSVTDRLTRMAHFIPCTKTVTGKEAATLFARHIFRLHGVPQKLISDKDPRFTSDFWQQLFKILGSKLAMSTAFHPQTDGLAERIHRTIETMLRHYVDTKHEDWDEKLYVLEFAYNNAPHSVTEKSPFELNYGFHPRLPATVDHPTPPDQPLNPTAKGFIEDLQSAWRTAQQALEKAQLLTKSRVDKHRKADVIKVGDLVLVHKRVLTSAEDGPAQKLTALWRGPFEVLAMPTAVNVKVKLGTHTSAPTKTFHVQHVKPYFGDPKPTEDQPGPAHFIATEPAYVVEKFLESKKHRNRRKRVIKEEILVRWLNWPPEHDSWVDAQQLRGDLGRDVFNDFYEEMNSSDDV